VRWIRAIAAVARDVAAVDEGRLSLDEALLRVDVDALGPALALRLPPDDALTALGLRTIARGVGASPGAATGRCVRDAAEAVALAEGGHDVVLVLRETAPEDVPAVRRCQALLETDGGVTSEGAVVARGLGIPCVVGLSVLRDAATLPVGAEVSVDGGTGRVVAGRAPVAPGADVAGLPRLLAHADAVRHLAVYASSSGDSERDARLARLFGADVPAERPAEPVAALSGTDLLAAVLAAARRGARAVSVPPSSVAAARLAAGIAALRSH
jgi:pyruvate,orthophosphate dikinase